MMASCSCKGIRYCKLCEQSDRVKAIKSECHPTEVRNFIPFCISCSSSGPCLHYPDNDCETELSGVKVYLDFISEAEEQHLVGCIDMVEWVPSQSGRSKQDYGPRANYKRQKLKLDKFEGLPEVSLFVRNQLVDLPELSDFIPVEQCNLDYKPELGSCIDFHFDDFWLWGERLVIVNLLSDCSMMFNYEDVFVKVPLPQRSLMVMSGDARFKWKHAIARGDVNARRISVTFRELSEQFLSGERAEEGKEIIKIASNLV